eukprot:5762196-Prymnesium_polylepis.2
MHAHAHVRTEQGFMILFAHGTSALPLEHCAAPTRSRRFPALSPGLPYLDILVVSAAEERVPLFVDNYGADEAGVAEERCAAVALQVPHFDLAVGAAGV